MALAAAGLIVRLALWREPEECVELDPFALGLGVLLAQRLERDRVATRLGEAHGMDDLARLGLRGIEVDHAHGLAVDEDASLAFVTRKGARVAGLDRGPRHALQR